MSLVRIRTSLKNKIHAVLARNIYDQEELASLTDIFGKKGMDLLKGIELSNPKDREILNGYIEPISGLDQKIKEVEKEIEKENEQDKDTQTPKDHPRNRRYYCQTDKV
jgi:transposase